jgi:polyribonucleotide nucleotidyltransferase
MEQKCFTATVGGKELIIETGRLANAANASCTVRMGDTMVLVTAVMASSSRDGMNWFPLMVDYEEKLYAAGRIKGSRFIKREGRPTDEAVLVSRFIDRSIRPLFNQAMRRDIQVIVTCLSFDGEHDPDILGLIGASCTLHASDIPWKGPIGAIRVAQKDGELIMNPTYEDREDADFSLDIAGDTEKVIMVEAVGNEAKEEDLVKAFEAGRAELAPIITLIEEFRAAVGKEKNDPMEPKTDEDHAMLKERVRIEEIAKAFLVPRIQELFFAVPIATKKERGMAKDVLKEELKAHLAEQGIEPEFISMGTGIIYDFLQMEVSRVILEKGERLDGRAIDEVRKLTIEAGFIPRVHGSGHFLRGETQALSILTLGAPGDAQILDGMETVSEKRYMHHYNFPPYSVGEAKPLRGAGRREIGHGALAEKALMPVLPSKEEFPYTIRVVSETMNSNGSSSMASTCGSTLALMDAGVPIKSPVAGIAMGIATLGDKWKVITDIQDLEDGPGGMDFKITGTKNGITAIQMDTKTLGITHEMVVQTLKQSKEARAVILKQMTNVISEPRAELSKYAPRIVYMTIDPEKIRDVIGPGGKMINKIIEETSVTSIDIEQDGTVMITSVNQESGAQAKQWVLDLTKEVEVGEVYTGKVDRIMQFGALVEILPGKKGLVHVSELAPWRVGEVGDIVKEGQEVQVKVIEIDKMGRTNLSMKQAEGNVYTDEMKEKAQKAPQGGGTGRTPNRKPHKPRD